MKLPKRGDYIYTKTASGRVIAVNRNGWIVIQTPAGKIEHIQPAKITYTDKTGIPF